MTAATALAADAADVTTATLRCIARFGLTKLTVEDVARACGRSRATLYRAYPSRRDLVASAVNDEIDRIVRLLVDVGRAAPTLADAVTDVIVTGARELRAHAALVFVALHERQVLHPYLNFAGGDRFYTVAATRLAVAFERWCADPARAAEWVVRVGLNFVCSTARPSTSAIAPPCATTSPRSLSPASWTPHPRPLPPPRSRHDHRRDAYYSGHDRPGRPR